MSYTIEVYDGQGQPRDLAWLKAKYGEFQIKPAAEGDGPFFLITELREKVNAAAAHVTTVQDEEGHPLLAIPVAWYWPDAPNDPNAGPAGGVLPSMNPNRCVVGLTNARGDVGPGMGGGAYYDPSQTHPGSLPTIGPHAVWIYGADSHSDLILGIGMLAGTNHDHFDVGYTRFAEDPRAEEPPVEPPDNEPPDEFRDIQVFDFNGDPMPWDDVIRDYGPQDLYDPGTLPSWQLMELWAEEGDHLELWVRVEDGNSGLALPGVPVAVGPRDVDGPILRGETDDTGFVRFQMSTDHRFFPPDMGHYVVAVTEGDGHVYNSAGWVGGQKRWLNLVFALVTEEELPPEPPEPPGPPDSVFEMAEEALGLHETASIHMDAAITTLEQVAVGLAELTSAIQAAVSDLQKAAQLLQAIVWERPD